MKDVLEKFGGNGTGFLKPAEPNRSLNRCFHDPRVDLFDQRVDLAEDKTRWVLVIRSRRPILFLFSPDDIGTAECVLTTAKMSV